MSEPNNEAKKATDSQKKARRRKRVSRADKRKNDPYKKAQEERIREHIKRMDDAKDDGLW